MAVRKALTSAIARAQLEQTLSAGLGKVTAKQLVSLCAPLKVYMCLLG